MNPMRDEGVGARAAMAVALAGTQALLSSGYNLLYQTFTGKESVPPSDGSGDSVMKTHRIARGSRQRPRLKWENKAFSRLTPRDPRL